MRVTAPNGSDEAIDRLAPVLDAVASQTHRLGATGAGTRLKLVERGYADGDIAAVHESTRRGSA